MTQVLVVHTSFIFIIICMMQRSPLHPTYRSQKAKIELKMCLFIYLLIRNRQKATAHLMASNHLFTIFLFIFVYIKPFLLLLISLPNQSIRNNKPCRGSSLPQTKNKVPLKNGLGIYHGYPHQSLPPFFLSLFKHKTPPPP